MSPTTPARALPRAALPVTGTPPRLNHTDRNALLMLCAFLVVWLGLAIAPADRAVWALENVPTVLIVGTCIATYRRFRFSDRAYLQALLFLVLHTIGSHYMYTNTPLGRWLQVAFGLERNPYDRIVHFLFGLLLFRAADEAFVREGPPLRRGFLALTVIAWWAIAYEFLEWGVARVVAPEQGIAFLAPQGDEWDTHKDLALGCLGAALAWAWEAGASALAQRQATPVEQV